MKSWTQDPLIEKKAVEKGELSVVQDAEECNSLRNQFGLGHSSKAMPVVLQYGQSYSIQLDPAEIAYIPFRFVTYGYV